MALNLHSQALVLMAMGDRPGARRLFERVVAIQEKALGPRRFAEAMQKGLQAEKRAREQFSRCAIALSEREALDYEAVRVSGLDTLLSALLSLGAPEDRRRAAPAAWDEEVRARAMVLDELATRHRALAGQGDASVGRQAEALAAARGALAQVLLRGPDPDRPETFAPDVRAAQARSERAERALAKSSAGFRREMDRRRAGLSEALVALPKETALLAYVRYGSIVEVGGASPVPSYLAFVSRPADRGVAVVPLGPAREIDTLVRQWHDEVSVDPRGAVGPGAVGPGAAARGLDGGARLRAAIWDPVAGLLEG